MIANATSGSSTLSTRPLNRVDLERGEGKNTVIKIAVNRYSDSKTPELKYSGIKLSEKDIPKLREQWLDHCSELFEVPLVLPPFREVNHEIKLIDESKQFNYHMPKCPDILKEQLVVKINRYMSLPNGGDQLPPPRRFP